MKIRYKIKKALKGEQSLTIGQTITILTEPSSWHSAKQGGRDSWLCPIRDTHTPIAPLTFPYTGKVLDLLPKKDDKCGVGAINVDGYGFSLRTINYIIHED